MKVFGVLAAVACLAGCRGCEDPPPAPSGAETAATQATGEVEPEAPEPEEQPADAGAAEDAARASAADVGAPPLSQDAKVKQGKRAWALLKDRWAKAIAAQDVKAYEALLGPQFRGSVDSGATSWERKAWVDGRYEAWKGVRDVRIGPPRMIVDRTGSTKMSVHLPVVVERADGCETGPVQVWVQLEGEGAPFIREEMWMQMRPCPELKKADIAAYHEKLRRTLSSVAPDRAEHELSAMELVEYGVVVDGTTWEGLADGKAAWVRKTLEGVEADFDRTDVDGYWGTVKTGDEQALVYEYRGDQWALAAIVRGLEL